MIATFTVHGPPLAWQRTAYVKGRPLTPAKQRQYQALVRLSIQRDVPQATRRYCMEAAPRIVAVLSAYVLPSSRADLDNIQKQIGDAAQGVLLSNDRQIEVWHARRVVVREGPRVDVVFASTERTDRWSLAQMLTLAGASHEDRVTLARVSGDPTEPFEVRP